MIYQNLPPIVGLAQEAPGECLTCAAFRRGIERTEKNGNSYGAAAYRRGLERHQELLPHDRIGDAAGRAGAGPRPAVTGHDPTGSGQVAY
ncbi:hypothetical protein [Streptomyces sp. UNOC14_S4]|uniref:hypothetical protein n=1 Tax=Streptomyces sp. UNOC14_S4 TaxID=2872340 RepID=UPI001E43F7D3|nr:hypothetical protein [Streptomyces sp. UNOC14_S4]MCC3769911.1 hypothetical protein [Streptomyces sp. UNOC14_S4]